MMTRFVSGSALIAFAFISVGRLPAVVLENSSSNTSPSLKFDFGSGKVAPGYLQVLPTTVYSKDHGFGFDLGTTASAVDRGGDSLRGDCCASEHPFFFSVTLPEGNYKVTVTLGDSTQETATTVKAESRRLMLEKITTAAGQFEKRSFTVNIRTPKIGADGSVKLKPREIGVLHWDDKLTLEFDGPHASVCALDIEKVEDAITVFLAGDSTVTDQTKEPYTSWGQMLTRFFDAHVAVANYAESGETAHGSIEERRLDKLLTVIKPGDYLFIQFGHNDQKEKGEGVGAFGRYTADLRHYIAEAKKRGAIPVLVTSMNRRTFDADGKITNSLGDFPEAVRVIAREDKIPLIDLNVMSKQFYEALGTEKAPLAFAAPEGKPVDGTHHNNYGSYELARCIVEGIKANQLGLAKYLDPAVSTFDPSHPDPVETWSIPLSPLTAEAKPDGS
jgi:lysophospholipase L1-like esterase